MRLFHGLSCFDSEKGHPNLLVATIVGRSAAELIRSRVRGKRLKPGAEVTHEVDELVAEPNDPSQVDLRLDLSPVLSKLPAELRALANQLMQRSVAALARELSLPQSTLRRRMAKLRTAFETAALDDYL